MDIMLFLISFPVAIALALLLVRNYTLRSFITLGAAIVLIAATGYLALQYMGPKALFFDLSSPFIEQTMLGIEILLAVYVVYLSIYYKQYLATLLMLGQISLILFFDFTYGHGLQTEHNLFLDNLSIIMALIIGVIGSLIAVFSLGYMQSYHQHHPEVKQRQPFFFFVIFVFLAAMFGVVFANNLMWLLFFWEITTLSSFFLIGYSRSEVAVKNAFRALNMNLLGGLAFAAAIIYLYAQEHIIELDKLSTLGSTVVLFPVALLCFAGITKSAQMPFSSWLLGAMVAPTPVSALLHSSTMVKAGVYLIIRLAPILTGTTVGLIVALVGAVSFLLASCIAISQIDAKRVLAYSTIANLGLIITCAGIGTYELVWAAIMLVIFHALAKGLLFLSTGPVEHNLGDREVETMDGLVIKMPKVAVGMIIGIAGMFLAPFGMLISKWAALEGLIKANPLLTVLLAFGSAATLFFWTKWLGKIIMVKQKPQNFHPKVTAGEQLTLWILALMTVGACLLFPLGSAYSIEPFIQAVYGESFALSEGNTIILLIMMGLVILLPLRLLFYDDLTYVEAYLSGTNTSEPEKFAGSMGVTHNLEMTSFRMDRFFGERTLNKLGIVTSSLLILMMLGVEFL